MNMKGNGGKLAFDAKRLLEVIIGNFIFFLTNSDAQ